MKAPEATIAQSGILRVIRSYKDERRHLTINLSEGKPKNYSKVHSGLCPTCAHEDAQAYQRNLRFLVELSLRVHVL